MMITAFNNALVIGVKIAGLVLSPDRIGIFSNACLTRKTVNIVNFSNDPCGIYIADTIDRGQGLRDSLHLLFTRQILHGLMPSSYVQFKRLILVVVHVNLIVNSAEAKMIRNDKGINIVIFGKLGIGIPELLDLLHMQVSVETVKTAAFAKETHEIITID